MARPSIRRPPKTSERSGPWVLTFVVVTVLALVAAYFGLRLVAQQLDGAWRPTFLLISTLGFISLGLFVISGFYTARKRMLQERVGGTMMAWLKAHVYLGLAALTVAVIHWLLTPLHIRVSSGTIALGLLALLIVSGFLWRVVYLRVPPKVPGDTGNLSIRDSRERASLFRLELDKLKVGRSRAFQDAVDKALVGKGVATEPPSDLPEEDHEAWHHAIELATQVQQEGRREKRQRRYARVLQAWRVLHLPLAVAALIAIGFHLYDVFNVGQAIAGDQEDQFASAEDCASCHADIVEEWKLSPHRFAQSSTITRAQTEVALETNPEFRKDCVNCHAPIGTKLSDSTTFPVGSDPGLNPDDADNEGITCVVCHTTEEHPEELTGFTDDFPVAEHGALGLGKMFGPPLEEDDRVPNSAHDTETGFMTDSIASSQMCGACHNVIADVDGNGLAPAGSDSAPNDSDDDGILDENEIDNTTDLVLQSTFNEWEDFLFSQGGIGPGCVDCHMPQTEGVVGKGSPLVSTPEQSRRAHTFVGVDYELNTDYYTQEGMPPGALDDVLEAREQLLQRAVSLTLDTEELKNGILRARVRIENETGHSFPTGFAFARQFWLEISATTSSGENVCLKAVGGFGSACTSGSIADASEDLPYCEEGPGTANKDVRLLSAFGRGTCDPWLVSFQKILTDADRDGDGVFEEIPYQTKRGDVVKNRIRVVEELNGEPDVMEEVLPKESTSFHYDFDVSGLRNEEVSVRAVLRHRHLAPYIVRELEPYFSADDPSAEELLANMTIVDIASNEPLGAPRTTPDIASRQTSAAGAKSQEGSRPRDFPWAFVPIGLFVAALVGVNSSRRTRRPFP